MRTLLTDVSIIHIITPEYHPHVGGVADYTRLLACGLANAGEQVHVWTRASPEARDAGSIAIHRDLGVFGGADLRRAGELLDRFPTPRRLLVQWVPHGFGRRSMNLGFCVWLWKRAMRGDHIELMVHEPYLHMTEGSWRQTAAALVHRVMTVVLLRSARRVWVSIPAWEAEWKPYALGRPVPFTWLPIPSSLSAPDGRAVGELQATLRSGSQALVGHLGTYGSLVASLLEGVLEEVLRRENAPAVLLLGINSDTFRSSFVARFPKFAGSIKATGALGDEQLAAHLAACDLVIQPYPDGVSSRRTTVMAALSMGVAVVTNRGRLTEPLWEDSHAVRLTSLADHKAMADEVCELLARPDTRRQIGRAGRELYARTFDLNRSVAALTNSRTDAAA